jgi:hypothetical protein
MQIKGMAAMQHFRPVPGGKDRENRRGWKN